MVTQSSEIALLHYAHQQMPDLSLKLLLSDFWGCYFDLVYQVRLVIYLFSFLKLCTQNI